MCKSRSSVCNYTLKTSLFFTQSTQRTLDSWACAINYAAFTGVLEFSHWAWLGSSEVKSTQRWPGLVLNPCHLSMPPSCKPSCPLGSLVCFFSWKFSVYAISIYCKSWNRVKLQKERMWGLFLFLPKEHFSPSKFTKLFLVPGTLEGEGVLCQVAESSPVSFLQDNSYHLLLVHLHN